MCVFAITNLLILMTLTNCYKKKCRIWFSDFSMLW